MRDNSKIKSFVQILREDKDSDFKELITLLHSDADPNTKLQASTKFQRTYDIWPGDPEYAQIQGQMDAAKLKQQHDVTQQATAQANQQNAQGGDVNVAQAAEAAKQQAGGDSTYIDAQILHTMEEYAQRKGQPFNANDLSNFDWAGYNKEKAAIGATVVGAFALGTFGAPVLGRLLVKALPFAGKTLAKYGIKLGKEALEKLLKELMEFFKNLFSEEGIVNNTQSDQLLQLDCQSIINRAKQTQDQYSMSVINQLQNFATQKLNVSQQTQDKSQDKQKVQEADFSKLKGAAQTLGSGFNKVLNSAGSQDNTSADSYQNQKRMLGQNPQDMTLKTDIQNLQKKCKIVNSEFSKNLLGAITPLL
jgi:hypothetical protein